MEKFLDTPQETFHQILKMYPHFIHGRAKDGCHVLYELLGQARPKDLIKAAIDSDGLVLHFQLRNEYLFQRMAYLPKSYFHTADDVPPGVEAAVYTDEDKESSTDQTGLASQQIMTVLDVKGIGITDITSDVINFIKKSSEIMDSHYPGRVLRLVICNAPSWFYSTWSVVARVLPDSVRKKISIIAGTKGLDEFIDPNQRPAEYGGADPRPLGEAEEHWGFLQLQKDWVVETPPEPEPLPASPPAPPSPVPSHGPDSAVYGWVRSRLSAAVGQSAPKSAYLGEKNSYRYDARTSSWTMDVQLEEKTTESSGKMSPSQLDEHGMVLAIQAAHLAARTIKKGGEASMDQDTSAIVDESDKPAKLPANIFLIVVTVYALTVFVQILLYTLLPIWLASPVNRGGMGASVLSRGSVISTSGLALYVLHALLNSRLLLLLKASPVRALRIGCGALVLLSILLPFSLSFSTSNPYTEAFQQLDQKYSADIKLHQSGTQEPKFVMDNLSISFLSIPLPSVLTALAVLFSQTSRKAAGMLLYIALAPSFSQPFTVITALGGFVEVTGPILAVMLFCSTYHYNLHFPMDSSFFLALSACACSFVYMISLLINVQFRGDFGVVSDEAMVQASMGQGLGQTGQNQSATHTAAIGLNSYRDKNQLLQGLSALLEVPLQDVSLLLSPPAAGYGSKLHNLKIDLKEV